MEPKISFVVPTRNRIEWIAECVGSLLSQTVKEIEVVIVDDNSDDGTMPFLREWLSGEDRVVFHRNEDRKGGGASRNIGAELARAPIIGVCDDDDFYSCYRAERILKFFENGKKGVLVNTPYVRVNQVSKEVQNFSGENFDEDEFKKSGQVNYFCNPSVAFLKEDFLEMGGYPPETPDKTDDYQFLTNWIKAGKKVGFDPDEFICFHRVLPNSMMAGHRGFDASWVKKGE